MATTMTRAVLPLAATLALLTSSPLVADDFYTGRYDSCMDASGGVTVEMLNCIDEELRTQDARLNGAYKALGKSLLPERREQLLAAQRLWIKYRDANCQFYASAGGSLAAVSGSECVLRETAERAKELEELQGGYAP